MKLTENQTTNLIKALRLHLDLSQKKQKFGGLSSQQDDQLKKQTEIRRKLLKIMFAQE